MILVMITFIITIAFILIILCTTFKSVFSTHNLICSTLKSLLESKQMWLKRQGSNSTNHLLWETFRMSAVNNSNLVILISKSFC